MKEPHSPGEKGMRIVVAEDDRGSRRMLSRILTKWGYEVFEATDGEEGWELLRTSEAPILVTDWQMPGVTGVDLCRRLRAAALPYYVYTILLTSKGDTDEVLEGFNAGADDYLTKPFNWEELRARVRAGERVVTLESDLREARARLEIMASTDELTGVANRREALRRLHEALSRARRAASDLSVAMIDIDKFKLLNDTYGHASGDLVLKETVRRLEFGKREYDVIGRLGGEEFVVVLPETNLENALVVSERLRAEVDALPFPVADGESVDVTISIGVACAMQGRCASVEVLLAVADEALYRAKELGRNRVESGENVPEAAHRTPGREGRNAA